MKFIERPTGGFEDRYETNRSEGIDVVMLTLDAENFLEKSLYSIYKEISVKKLIICDGDSKDSTLEILKSFPRVELHIRSDIMSGGKGIEFLFSKVNTDWFVLIDSDIFLSKGWFDEMKKYQGKYDVIENSKSILTYHFYREFKDKLDENYRASHLCHLSKKDAVKNYHCDDGEVYRITDYLFRQSIEESGFRYGKVITTEHQHNETERIPYESDSKKAYMKIIMKDPERIVLDKQKQKEMLIQNAKSVIKYLDPNFLPFKEDRNLDSLVKMLDRKWIEENGSQWLNRFDSFSSPTGRIKDAKQIAKKKGLKYLVKRMWKT